MKQKTFLSGVVGFVLGIAACIGFGFTGASGGFGSAMMVPADGGGAYLYTGTHSYYLSKSGKTAL